MGPGSSSRSGMKRRRSDETTNPFWKRVATYLGGVFGKRPSGPRVSSSRSDTIGIGRPFYTDTIKRTSWGERPYKKRDDVGDGAGDKPAAHSGDGAASAVTSDNGSQQTSANVLVLEDLKRRGVPIQHCSPRALPPPPGQADVATSTESVCASHGSQDSTTQEERHPPESNNKKEASDSDTESLSTPGQESMTGSTEKTTVAVSKGKGKGKVRGNQQRRTQKRNAVEPNRKFQYSLQDSRHWNKTLVLTATGSRVEWSTQRKRHTQQMQHCDKPRRKKPPVVAAVEMVSLGNTSVSYTQDENDDLGSFPLGNGLNMNKVGGVRRHRLWSLPGSVERVQMNRQMRQDTRSELLHGELPEKHETCGTVSECTVPGFSFPQATNSDTDKRHPIVSNILKMLDANTQTSQHKSLTTSSQDTKIPKTNNLADSNLRQDADTPQGVEDFIARRHQRELYSSYYKLASSEWNSSGSTVDSEPTPRQKLVCDWATHQRNQYLSPEAGHEYKHNTTASKKTLYWKDNFDGAVFAVTSGMHVKDAAIVYRVPSQILAKFSAQQTAS